MTLRNINVLSLSRRSPRRRFVLISALCLVVLFRSHLRNILSANDTTNIAFKTFIEPLAAPVTIVRTQYPKETVVQQPAHYVGQQVHLNWEELEEEPEVFFKAEATESLPILDHRYQPNGLLAVNPKGQHPIYDLIERNEAAWQVKLQKASRNLHEAVIEYQRRYGREPPKGFDKWWQFVQEHNVQLPDEYDQIHRDLEGFWGVDPQDLQTVDLQAFQLRFELEKDIYTIGKLDIHDPITVLNTSDTSMPVAELVETGNNIIAMLKKFDVDQYIPPFRVMFSAYDNPVVPKNWEIWNEGVEHAKKGTTFPLSNSRTFTRGWRSSCDPQSPALTAPIDFSAPYPDNLRPSADPMAPINQRTFIHDHVAAMDPCQHPHLLRRHGQYVAHNEGPAGPNYLIPLISLSPSPLHMDITAAIPMNWIEDVYNPEWDARTDERLHWRGANTGVYHANFYQWDLTHRINMMRWAQLGWSSTLRILGLGAMRGERVGEGTVVHKTRWAPATLDIGFAGEPIACEKEDGTCDALADMFEWKKKVSVEEAGNYKYTLDMDGNAWSSRFKRLITTSSCIFKATVYPEWFTDRLQPWVHYVPVQMDLSDLWDSFAFFRGDLNGDHGHDDLAKKIGAQGRDWSLKYWREEDIVAYNFRLFLEYARLMSSDRESMSYHSH